MINREKVLEAIERCVDKAKSPNCYSDCYYDGCVFRHGDCRFDMLADAIALLKEQPEIVRCNECKYARHDDLSGAVFCTKLTEKYTTQDDKAVSEDWFCADGER